MKIAVLAAALFAFAGAASACPFSAEKQAEAPVTKPAPTS
jgi:hypothetical protein